MDVGISQDLRHKYHPTHHTIERDAKPFQQKIREMYPSLEPLVKKELNKLLTAKILFLVRHTTLVANLVLVKKKSGEIQICIYFRNLN